MDFNQQNAANMAMQQQADKQSYQQMMMIGYVFTIIGTVISAFFFLIPLLWTIPACIKTAQKMRAPIPTPTIGLGVFVLILVSLIGGIFILLANSYSSLFTIDNNFTMNQGQTFNQSEQPQN